MRTKISTLLHRPLILRKPTPKEQEMIGQQHSQTLLLCHDGNIVAQIEVEDVFDGDGNNFEDDVS